MWKPLPEDGERDWEREWFGDQLNPGTVFSVRGIGIREPMFNENVHRPMGTGDWLIMFFHEPPRLDPGDPAPSDPARTMMIWPRRAAQYYSWGRKPELERHSWMHVEGTWVEQQVRESSLPLKVPFQLPDASVMIQTLEALIAERRLGPRADTVILQNLFQNWARATARQFRPAGAFRRVPTGLLRVQKILDADFSRIPPLDELAEIAAMSRSHLCHRFREHFGSSISEYVIRKRMSAAQRMLFDLSLRPGEIAEAVGYRDIYQFSKQFKKSFGVSPTRYRKDQVEGAGE